MDNLSGKVPTGEFCPPSLWFPNILQGPKSFFLGICPSSDFKKFSCGCFLWHFRLICQFLFWLFWFGPKIILRDCPQLFCIFHIFWFSFKFLFFTLFLIISHEQGLFGWSLNSFGSQANFSVFCFFQVKINLDAFLAQLFPQSSNLFISWSIWWSPKFYEEADDFPKENLSILDGLSPFEKIAILFLWKQTYQKQSNDHTYGCGNINSTK